MNDAAARAAKHQLMNQLARFQEQTDAELLGSWRLRLNAGDQVDRLYTDYRYGLISLEDLTRSALGVEAAWLRLMRESVYDALPGTQLARLWLGSVEAATELSAALWSLWFEQAVGLRLNWLNRALAPLELQPGEQSRGKRSTEPA